MLAVSAFFCAVLLWWSAASAAEPEHYSLVTVRLLSMSSDTMVDEVWSDGNGNWRLERRSDHWDNGMLLVCDGKRVQLRIPQIEQTLEIPLNTLRSVVDPTVLNVVQPTRLQMKPVREENVMGRPALFLQAKSGEYMVNRWIDKETKRALREERLDRQGRPFLVLVRNDLATPDTDGQHYQFASAAITKQAAEWRAQAVSAWVANQLHVPIKLNGTLPAALRLAGADLLRGQSGTVVALRLTRGEELVSIFFAPAKGAPPANRRLLDKGLPVLEKRVGQFDVTLVGELSNREADLVLDLLAKQLAEK